ncbi:MAG: glutathione S-transferase family protein [Rhodospirillales bacterium]
MTVTLFGAPRTRAYRVAWMLEELGLDYRSVSVTAEEAASSGELLAVNPFGKVPALDDEGLHLWDSYAINHYLGRKHGAPLGPQDLAEEGQLLSWAFWTATAVEPLALIALTNGFLAPEDERDPEKIPPVMEALDRPLKVLDAYFDRKAYLVGERFTVADVNLVSVLGWVAISGGDLSPYPFATAWLARCGARPAARLVLSRMGL